MRYLFIDTMVSTDLADIQRIADCRLGPAYLSPAKILHKEWEAFSAYKGSRVVGFLCASLLPLAVFQGSIRLSPRYRLDNQAGLIWVWRCKRARVG